MTRRRSEAPPSSNSPAVRAYVWLIVLIALGLAAVAARTWPLSDDWLTLGVLCAMGVLGEFVREKDVGRRTALSFTSIVLLSSVALLGPLGAALVGGVSQTGDFSRRPPLTRLFNAAMHSVIASLGGFVYLLVGGLHVVGSDSGAPELLLRVGLPLMVADVAMCLSNAVILAGVVRLSANVPLRRFITQMLGTSGLAYIGYGVIGFLFVVLWIPAGVGPFSAVLILAPLFTARWAFVQYGDEQRAHARTLSALVAAVETKDPYTRGHSERVALLCDLMAGSLSLNHQDTEALRFAGMLHDIGRLAIPTRMLRRSDALSEAELARMATHPERGVEMVRDIEFLAGSIEAIRHHHERMDGRGYPGGLSGEQIPLFARVIAVADAFDSLTTSRSHRDAHTVEEAMVELHRRAGTHLDPTIVIALEKGLARQVWEPSRLEPALMATPGGAFDHDDPAASDLMATPPSPTPPSPERSNPEPTHASTVRSPPADSELHGADGADPVWAKETAP